MTNYLVILISVKLAQAKRSKKAQSEAQNVSNKIFDAKLRFSPFSFASPEHFCVKRVDNL